MQRLRNRASLFHARAQRFDAVPEFFAERAGAILVAHHRANGAFQSGEVLADAVVQVAADAPPFILLRAASSTRFRSVISTITPASCSRPEESAIFFT